MNILIDIGHPAHVHLFKNFAKYMQNNGHRVLFTCREKEFEIYLLEHYGFEYKSFGKKYKSTAGKIFGLIKFDLMEFLEALKFKPDLFLSAGSMYAAHAAFLYRKPHFAFEDTFNMEQVKLYLPFTKKLFASKIPDGINIDKDKIFLYRGYHELAYLHPNWFKSDNSILDELGIKEGEDYFLIRFVSWNASHDRGQEGISFKQKEELIETLSKRGKVFISSEGELPKRWEEFRLKVAPHRIHDVMAYATMFIGEGATMASECAMLGTPAIYVNSLEAETIKDQQNYGLLFHFKNGDGVLEKVNELLSMPNLKDEFQRRKERMLKDKIDVSRFLIDYVEGLL